jgi:hypothetical protein
MTCTATRRQKQKHLPSPWAPIERAVGPIVASLATVTGTGTGAYTIVADEVNGKVYSALWSPKTNQQREQMEALR